ncbi:hypothetical protein DFP72DRAFT_894197 [Ephemerocybe angulata]|uniref:Ribonuclease H1 N-terminal domain-containing protein n=1 Tax=Ephemerocybe angulata TaxID=980116 RepID=A0A8H6I0E2_9AGAR|nr:hypothetical protein DFP72DRAFT_894197 [Tulosesus angulatus]
MSSAPNVAAPNTRAETSAAIISLLGQFHTTVNMLFASMGPEESEPRIPYADLPNAMILDAALAVDTPLAVPPAMAEESTASVASTPTVATPEAPAQELPAPAAAVPAIGKWYAVLIGREPGVYPPTASRSIDINIKGIPGNNVIKFDTQAEAEEFYKKEMAKGQVMRVNFTCVHQVLRPDQVDA